VRRLRHHQSRQWQIFLYFFTSQEERRGDIAIPENGQDILRKARRRAVIKSQRYNRLVGLYPRDDIAEQLRGAGFAQEVHTDQDTDEGNEKEENRNKPPNHHCYLCLQFLRDLVVSRLVGSIMAMSAGIRPKRKSPATFRRRAQMTAL
jgi:hypothetical protein